MKNSLIYLMIVALLCVMGYAFYDFEVNPEKYGRKSKPPKEITDPNEVKWRTDICEVYDDTRRGPRQSAQNDRAPESGCST
jgi:hypothetical protein